MGKIVDIVHGLKPPTLMVVNQLMLASVSIVYKLAANDGMSLRILVAYRLIFATAVMVPLALILERKSLGDINRKVLLQAFFCGLFGGSLAQNLYLQSLVYTSATFISAIINLVPAITFILGILFKLEKLGLGTTAGKAKALGTIIGIGGAMVFTFYKGLEINIWSTNVDLLHHHHQLPQTQSTGKFILGAFFGLLSCIFWALWMIVQAKMDVTFPYLISSTALMCIMGSIQGTVIALCTERDWTQWKLGWNIRLLAAAFSAIMGSAVMAFLVSWGVRLKGPLYVSTFNPLGLLFVAIAGSLMLDEKLHLGSIIGGIIIVCGLYVVLWGKAKELKQINQLVPTGNESQGTKEEDLDGQIENQERAEAAVPPQIAIQIQP